jgi:Caspase domain
VLDACQSGIAGSEVFTTNDAVVSALTTKANAPLIVLAASKGRQLSHETMGRGGQFTNAVVAAILAKRNNNGVDGSALIDLGELYSSVKSRVFVETNGEQTPWLTRNGLVGEISLF